MTKIESRIGIIKESAAKIYTFMSDFDNFRDLIPQDQVSNWESTGDTCKFDARGIGTVGLKIIEKEPDKLVKMTNDGGKPVPFFVWIQIKEVAENDSRIKITAEVKLNAIMASMIKKPLKSFVDTLVSQAEHIEFK